MDLTHRFSVPVGVHEAWNAFNDVEHLAPCFPGATVTSVQGDRFSGKLKIKLGPATLVYNGSGRYVERNETERRVLIEATGSDRRRNGTAAATVTAAFTDNGDQTNVEVLTNLAVTGKPAQFGDEVIADVSQKLLDQFVDCISRQFAEGLGVAKVVSAGSGVAAGTAGGDQAGMFAGVEQAAAPNGVEQADIFAGMEQAAAPGGFDQADTEQTIELEAVPAGEAPATGSATDVSSPGLRGTSPAAASEPAPPTAAGFSEPRGYQASGAAGESTLDVLRTVGPVLLKRYGLALAVLGLLVVVVIKIVRRKS